MSEVKRNATGFVVPPDPKFAAAGESTNARDYIGVAKTNAAPGTLNPDGSSKYATDGVTTDWWHSHKRPEEPKS
jgi:hypothetical protein